MAIGILDSLASRVPEWMVTAPRDAFLLLMSGPGALVDAMGEAVYQARIASLPGQSRVNGIPGLGGFDSVAALFLIARDRLVIPAQIIGLPWQGEKPWDLALRCRDWRDDWINNVGPFGLLDQLAYAMAPTAPLLRLVQRGGGVTSWYTRQTDGTRRLQRSDGNGWAIDVDGNLTADTTVAQLWDWNSASRPTAPDLNDASSSWIVAYAPDPPFLTATDGTGNDPGVADDAWNNPAAQVNGQPTAGTGGTNAPVGFVALCQNIATQRRTAGNKTTYLIWAFDPLSFAPDGSSSGDAQAFTFSNIANVTVSGGGAIATKSAGAAAYNAFAISTTGVTGLEGSGSFDYTITALPAVVMTVGAAWSVTPAVVDTWFGFTVYADGHLEVYESGIVRTLVGGAGYLSAGAAVRVSVNPNGTPATYWVNHGAGWVLVYASPTGPVFTLKAFVALWTVGDTVTCTLRKSAYPAGTWEWHTTPDDGLGQRVIARLQTAEYWQLTDIVVTPAIV